MPRPPASPGAALPTVGAAPAGASPAQVLPGHGSGCAVLAVTLVSQGQVRESDNGPSTPQGGLGVHRGLCVKQGVTSTRVPSKVLPCSQNKQAVRGGAGRGCRGGGSAPSIAACPRGVPGLRWRRRAGAWDGRRAVRHAGRAGGDGGMAGAAGWRADGDAADGGGMHGKPRGRAPRCAMGCGLRCVTHGASGAEPHRGHGHAEQHGREGNRRGPGMSLRHGGHGQDGVCGLPKAHPARLPAPAPAWGRAWHPCLRGAGRAVLLGATARENGRTDGQTGETGWPQGPRREPRWQQNRLAGRHGRNKRPDGGVAVDIRRTKLPMAGGMAGNDGCRRGPAVPCSALVPAWPWGHQHAAPAPPNPHPAAAGRRSASSPGCPRTSPPAALRGRCPTRDIDGDDAGLEGAGLVPLLLLHGGQREGPGPAWLLLWAGGEAQRGVRWPSAESGRAGGLLFGRSPAWGLQGERHVNHQRDRGGTQRRPPGTAPLLRAMPGLCRPAPPPRHSP